MKHKPFISWDFVSIPITNNKSIEYQLELGDRLATKPFEFSLRWTHNSDHAGIRFAFSIYKLFFLELSIHDNRHWDYENNRWCEGA